MTKRNLGKMSANFILAIIFLLEPASIIAENAVYTIVDEDVYDVPIKTQITQYFVVSGIPTKADLKSEIMKRFVEVSGRGGFKYYNPATNIYIYIYSSTRNARLEQNLWIGMLAKNFPDKAPQIYIDDGRLAALSQTPQKRFGKSESDRKRLYRNTMLLARKSSNDAIKEIPDTRDSTLIKKQWDLKRELEERYTSELAQENDLTKDQLDEIFLEGLEKGWPTI